MSSRNHTPFWRQARTLAIMFWIGVCCAPLAALLLVVGDSAGTVKLALLFGMGTVVLIGLSVTLRKDAGQVEEELNAALSDVDANAHSMVAELRAEMRSIGRGPNPGPALGAGRATPPRGEPMRAMASHDEPMRGDPRHQPMPHHEPASYVDEARPRPRAEHVPPEQRRRPEAAYEDTGEMVRLTETVKVTHRETRTMRAEPDADYRPPYADEEAGVYRGRTGKSSRSRRDRSEAFDAHAEADSLLSGLSPQPGHEDDWQDRDSAAVPRQRSDRREDLGYHTPSRGFTADPERRPSRHGRDDDYQPRNSGGIPRSEPRAWRTEERSAELRMGMRQSRSAPENGWQDDDRGAESWSVEPTRRGRHYDMDAPEPTRAISMSEAERQTRWGDYENGGSRGSSYMDEYYGERRR